MVKSGFPVSATVCRSNFNCNTRNNYLKKCDTILKIGHLLGGNRVK